MFLHNLNTPYKQAFPLKSTFYFFFWGPVERNFDKFTPFPRWCIRPWKYYILLVKIIKVVFKHSNYIHNITSKDIYNISREDSLSFNSFCLYFWNPFKGAHFQQRNIDGWVERWMDWLTCRWKDITSWIDR